MRDHMPYISNSSIAASAVILTDAFKQIPSSNASFITRILIPQQSISAPHLTNLNPQSGARPGRDISCLKNLAHPAPANPL